MLRTETRHRQHVSHTRGQGAHAHIFDLSTIRGRDPSCPIMKSVLPFLLYPALAYGHGHITFPHSSRHGGSLATGGRCDGEGWAAGDVCSWFTQPTTIPGKPTLPDYMRTNNVNVTSGVWPDWSVKSPWRAPGTAPVQGSGCGVGGGNPVPLPNGGKSTKQGLDGADLAPQEPSVWARGSTQEVGFAMYARPGHLCVIASPSHSTCVLVSEK
jgi:hypothetical protein